MAREWRAVVAALANDAARRVYAEIVLGVTDEDAATRTPPLTAAKRARALEQLLAAGLVRPCRSSATAKGTAALTLEAPSEVLLELLAHAAEPRREGIHRFIVDGRIETYPAKPVERRAVLEWAAEQAVRAGEVLTEAELGERLSPLRDDVATLRRYLVDEGLLVRTPSGTSYSRA